MCSMNIPEGRACYHLTVYWEGEHGEEWETGVNIFVDYGHGSLYAAQREAGKIVRRLQERENIRGEIGTSLIHVTSNPPARD